MSDKRYLIPEDDSAKESKQDSLISEAQDAVSELETLNTTSSSSLESADETALNTYATKEMVKSLYSQLEDIKDLLKLILS